MGPSHRATAPDKQAKNIECTMFERKMDNCKPCGGAIPLCMVEEFTLPPDIIDRRVRKMKMISPSGREVDVGRTLKAEEYIGMLRREVMDGFLRERAVGFGATAVNGLVQKIAFENVNGPYTVRNTRSGRPAAAAAAAAASRRISRRSSLAPHLAPQQPRAAANLSRRRARPPPAGVVL
jgi:flavin-dependent dehydrogenase